MQWSCRAGRYSWPLYMAMSLQIGAQPGSVASPGLPLKSNSQAHPSFLPVFSQLNHGNHESQVLYYSRVVLARTQRALQSWFLYYSCPIFQGFSVTHQILGFGGSQTKFSLRCWTFFLDMPSRNGLFSPPIFILLQPDSGKKRTRLLFQWEGKNACTKLNKLCKVVDNRDIRTTLKEPISWNSPVWGCMVGGDPGPPHPQVVSSTSRFAWKAGRGWDNLSGRVLNWPLTQVAPGMFLHRFVLINMFFKLQIKCVKLKKNEVSGMSEKILHRLTCRGAIDLDGGVGGVVCYW